MSNPLEIGEVGGKFVMEFEDFERFQIHLDSRPRARLNKKIIWGAILAATGLHVWTFLTTGFVNWTLAVIVLVSAFVAIFGIPWMQRRAWKQNLLWLQRVSFVTTQDGFELKWGDNNATVTAWDRVIDVETTQDYVFVWLGKIHAIVLPHRAFENEKQIEQFIQIVQSRSTKTDGS